MKLFLDNEMENNKNLIQSNSTHNFLHGFNYIKKLTHN